MKVTLLIILLPWLEKMVNTKYPGHHTTAGVMCYTSIFRSVNIHQVRLLISSSSSFPGNNFFAERIPLQMSIIDI